jgi:nicotinic acid mononucleotide adenylyltransferase
MYWIIARRSLLILGSQSPIHSAHIQLRSNAMPQLDDSHIAATAYLIWLDEGQPDGRDQDHWQRARLALAAETVTKRAKKAAPKADAPKIKATPNSTAATPRVKSPAKPRTPRKAKAPE